MTPSQPTTEALLEQARFLRALARSLVSHDADADEVVQETWLAALANPPRRPGPLRPWLASVARNAARKLRRSAQRRGDAEANLEPISAQADTSDVLDALGAALQALPVEQRRVLHARFTEGLPPRAIARRDGLELETVKSRLRRALSALRERLDREYPDRRSWSLALAPLIQRSSETPTTLLLGALMKSKILVTSVVVAALGGAWWYWPNVTADAAPNDPIASTSSAVEVTSPNLAVDTGRTELAGVKPEPIVKGRVTSTTGEPVPNARVFVGALEDPFGPATAENDAGFNQYVGRIFHTDADGFWSARLPEAVPVWIRLSPNSRSEPLYSSPEEERRVVPPAECDFQVEIVPSSRLTIRATDLGTRAPLDVFGFRITWGDTGGVHSRWSQDGRAIVPVRSELERVTVTLTSPELDPPPSQVVRLSPGSCHEVELMLASRDRTVGRVVDVDGRPLAEAYVWFGPEQAMRGDEPFEAFEERFFVGARTDPAGFFELAGEGELVSAWHAAHSPATVAQSDSTRIELRPRGRIEGIAAWADGRARAGLEIRLDEALTTRTDELGRFVFEHVEAGVRGLEIEGEQRAYVRVDVRPEETTDVRLGDRLKEVRLRVVRAGIPWEQVLDGGVVPLDHVGSVPLIRATGPHIALRDMFPGRYLLMDVNGRLASFDVTASDAMVELGDARLTVLAKPETPVALAPAGSDELVRLLARRVQRFVPEDGKLVYDPLPPGDYEVQAGREGNWKPISVAPTGSEITIPADE